MVALITDTVSCRREGKGVQAIAITFKVWDGWRQIGLG
jgi:hypothetical protein